MSNLINDSKLDNKKVQSFEYEKSVISDGNIIGTCELGVASMELLNDTNTYTEVKGSWINTCHGSFYVSKVESAQEKVKIKLECYDIKYKLDIPFDPSLYSFPCTLMELRNKVFESSGVLYDNTPFPNSDMVLSEMPFFEEGISNRNVISIIAQAGGSFVDTDSSDKFYFRYFTDKVYPVNDYQELTTEKELTRPVNVIVLGRGDAEDNVYYPEDIKDKVPFRIDNNYILDSQDVNSEEDKRRTSIIPLYDRLKGTSYLEFSMKTSTMDNKLELNLGDKVRYKDIWGNIIEAPVMKKKLIYLGGNALDNKNYKLEISSEEIKEVSTDFNYASTIEDKIKRTEFKVDKQEGIIEALVKDTNDNFSKISQDYESITSRVESVESVQSEVVVDIKREYKIEGTDVWLEEFPNTKEQVISRDKLIYKDGHFSYTNEAKIKGEKGADGIPGINSYFHIRYSENADGHDMTVNPTELSKYMGVAVTENEDAPELYSDYSWISIKGNNGMPGSSGEDGRSSYLHIMYSEDGSTFTPEDEEFKEGKKPSAWYGQYVDFIEEDSTEFNRYEWYKFTGNIDADIRELQSDVAQNKTLLENTKTEINNQLGEYVKESELNSLKSSVETAINDNQYFIGVYKEIIENGVSKVKTSNNFTFDKDGLHIGSDSSKTKNVIDTKAMTIYKNDNEELLFAGYEDTINQSIVKVDNITVKNYFVIPGVRVEKYDNSDIGKTGTGFFNLKVGDK